MWLKVIAVSCSKVNLSSWFVSGWSRRQSSFEMSLQFGGVASAATSAILLWIAHSIRQFESRQWPLHFCTRRTKRLQQDKFTRWLRKVMSVGSFAPSSKQSINPKTALACMNCSIHVRVCNTKVFTNSARRTGNVEYFTLATLTFFAGHLCNFISPVFRADVRIGIFLNAKWFLSETFVRKGRRNARYTCRRWWMVNGGFLWSESRGWLPGYVIVTRT